MYPTDMSAWNLGGPSNDRANYPPGASSSSYPGMYPGSVTTGYPPQLPGPYNLGPPVGFPCPTIPNSVPGSAYNTSSGFPTSFYPATTPGGPPNPSDYPGSSQPALTSADMASGPTNAFAPYSSTGFQSCPLSTTSGGFPPTVHGFRDIPQMNPAANPAPPAPGSLRGAHEDIYAPTLQPCPNFNASEDCQRLRKAMKGMGTDEKTIIDIMGHRSVDQRVKIVLQFKTMFGKDLIKEFKSELSGHFYDCVEALCYPSAEFDAMQLRKAVKGAGTDEDALIEILCTRTNEQIRQIKEAYGRIFQGRVLEKDVVSDTSGHFKRVLVSLLQASRDESPVVDMRAARLDAEALYRAGEKRLGTDESTFNMILASKSFAHLRVVFEEYSKLSKHDIEQALKSEMSGDLLQSMLAIVRCIRNKQLYFAQQLMKSMKGLGTKDRTLIRLVVSRCEIDMRLIKQEFQKAYGKTLESWITDDTSGDYRRLLLALVSG